MNDKTGKPTEYFTSVQANNLVKIALKWNKKETETLQKLVHINFEKVLTAIQRSSLIRKMTEEISGHDAEQHDKQVTPQEIIKIRKAILSLLNWEEEQEGEEENSEQHASPELAETGAAIQGLYTSWTYFNNTKLLATSIHDFCEEWVRTSLSESEEPSSGHGNIKTKSFSQDDDYDDDDFWDDDIDEVHSGDIAIIKIIPDILQAYLFYLNRYPQSGIIQVLEDESESGRWQDMRSVVADMKRLLMHTKLVRRLKNSINYNFDSDTRGVLNEIDSYSLSLPKE